MSDQFNSGQNNNFIQEINQAASFQNSAPLNRQANGGFSPGQMMDPEHLEFIHEQVIDKVSEFVINGKVNGAISQMLSISAPNNNLSKD
jgi:hypothetical protein